MRGQAEIRDQLREFFTTLEADDIKSTASGVTGEDLQLSPAARKLFPYCVEIKRLAKVAIARAYEQAESHGSYEPVVFFKEDRGKWLAIISFQHFLDLLKKSQAEPE